MKNQDELKKAYIEKIDQFRKLMTSIETNMNSYGEDHFYSDLNWGHIGSMSHVIDQLNNIDMHLAGTHFEKNIDDRIFDETARKFK